MLDGAFVWARKALDSPQRRFPARAVHEFLSLYLSAVSGGNLSHTSQGFHNIISEIDRKQTVQSIEIVMQDLLRVCNGAHPSPVITMCITIK
jgi:hypothetical protein